MSKTLSTGSAKARKVHRCSWCLESIQPGETYIYHTGIFDGDFFSSKLHAECKEAWDDGSAEFKRDLANFGYSEGEFKRGSREPA